MTEWLNALKTFGDVISVGTLIGYLVGALPVIATILTIIWTALRIYEMDTVQKWIKGRGKNPLS